MGLSFWHITIVALLIVLLFGRGKISDLMGDLAKGIRSFKKGLHEDDDEDERRPAPKVIRQQDEEAVEAAADKSDRKVK